jgi:hypothetical protein
MKFDEDKHLFNCKKFNKEIKFKATSKTLIVNRLKRHIVERYRQFLIDKKGKGRTSISEFKLFTDYLTIDNIILINRATSQKYSLDLSGSFKQQVEQAV